MPLNNETKPNFIITNPYLSILSKFWPIRVDYCVLGESTSTVGIGPMGKLVGQS